VSDHDARRLPIGYWLERADELLTARIDEAQRENGPTRLSWQVINVVHERGMVTGGEVAVILRPFAEGAAVNEVLADLAEGGVLDRTAGGGFDVTPAGTELYTRALAAQLEVRQRAVAGIGEAAFETTVRVVQRLVANLESGDTT
jgi:hypothetical protein